MGRSGQGSYAPRSGDPQRRQYSKASRERFPQFGHRRQSSHFRGIVPRCAFGFQLPCGPQIRHRRSLHQRSERAVPQRSCIACRGSESGLPGWACRIRTSESVRGLSDWSYVATSFEVGAGRVRWTSMHSCGAIDMPTTQSASNAAAIGASPIPARACVTARNAISVTSRNEKPRA
jgi:hypothetical protein